MKWVNKEAAVNVDNSKNHYNFSGIDEDEEKVIEDSHNEFFKFVNVSAGIGRGFSNTQEL